MRYLFNDDVMFFILGEREVLLVALNKGPFPLMNN